MTSSIQHVLVIGGGFAGMSAAIELRKHGVTVDLIEKDPGWRSYGAGISLGGATLRAFRTLGILGEFLGHGHAGDGLSLYTADHVLLSKMPTPRIAGADVPGSAGILRPVLARILADATRASGARVLLGTTLATLKQDAEGVDVSLSNGETGRYDLVIGADGLYSSTRALLFPQAPTPRYTGQAVWRAVLPCPPEIDHTHIWLGVRGVKPGVKPVSRTHLYMFVTEDCPQRLHVDPAGFVGALRALLAPFPSPQLQALREQIGEDSQIVFRPLEGLLMPRPWFSGRAVLIGDAVHATTPHLASGACIGIEDAIVLADELQHGDVPDALQRFQDRRWERCRMVVENSGRLGEMELSGSSGEDQARLLQSSFAALAQPI